MKTNSITPLIAESERVLAAAVKHFGLKVKPADITVTIQSAGRKQALGWFWGESWQNGRKEKIHEINLCAEHLTNCDIGEVLIHELAHAENRTLKIKDCSGRQHNKAFKSMAERLGLTVKPRDKSVGYGYTELGDAARKFLRRVGFNSKVFSSYRCGVKSKTKPGSRLLKAECPECGYVCRVTQKWLDDAGAPVCPTDEVQLEVV